MSKLSQTIQTMIRKEIEIAKETVNYGVRIAQIVLEKDDTFNEPLRHDSKEDSR